MAVGACHVDCHDVPLIECFVRSHVSCLTCYTTWLDPRFFVYLDNGTNAKLQCCSLQSRGAGSLAGKMLAKVSNIKQFSDFFVRLNHKTPYQAFLRHAPYDAIVSNFTSYECQELPTRRQEHATPPTYTHASCRPSDAAQL